jgi:hypothetical protein
MAEKRTIGHPVIYNVAKLLYKLKYHGTCKIEYTTGIKLLLSFHL